MSSEIKTGSIPVKTGSTASHSSQRSAKAPAQSRGADSGAIQTEHPGISNDTVSMTESVSRLQEIEAQLASIPSVDSVKISEIKQAINAGTYQIDPHSIASKLIALESSIIPTK